MGVEPLDDEAAVQFATKQFEDFGFVGPQCMDHGQWRRILGFEHERSPYGGQFGSAVTGDADHFHGVQRTILPDHAVLAASSSDDASSPSSRTLGAVGGRRLCGLALDLAGLKLVNS